MLAESASIIVPVYNEGDCIDPNTAELVSYLKGNLSSFELILVENGSKDDTLSKAITIAQQHPEVRCLSIPKPCLGEALKTGISHAVHGKVVYYPIDLSVNLSFISECITLLNQYPIVSGSKRLRKGRDKRPIKRRFTSKGYHFLVRKLFGTTLTDTTCVKGYQRNTVLELMNTIPTNSLIYETELLIQAQQMGLTIHQIPVTVTDPRPGRQPLSMKILTKLQDLLSLRLDLLSILLGGGLFLMGSLGILLLSIKKLLVGEGFLNPYSFLSSILLVIFGFQCIIYGSFARLLLQLR